MFTNANLSFEAAPPINVVLRFFLTGAIFATLAGVAIFFNFDTLFNIYAPSTLSIVHILTLGVVTNFLLGALFQMLPVIAGVSIANSQLVAMRVHYTLLVGIIFLLSAFLDSSAILYLLAAIFLGFSLFYSSFVGIRELIKINHSSSSKGMLYSLISFIFVVILAFILIYLKNGFSLGVDFLEVKKLHLFFGLFGVFMLLIFSVSFQVIEMFYVTPPYPKEYAKYVTTTIFGLLLLSLIAPKWSSFFISLIALIAIYHSITTLKLLKAKKRAVTDVTIWLWYLGMVNLILFSLGFILNNFFDINIVLLSIFFSFFILSIILAMVFKIVPFLVWFQLNRQGYFDGPMMHEVIHPKVAKRVFYIFISSYILFIGGVVISLFAYIGAILFFSTFLTLAILIYLAWQKYIFTLKNGTKIDFPSNV